MVYGISITYSHRVTENRRRPQPQRGLVGYIAEVQQIDTADDPQPRDRYASLSELAPPGEQAPPPPPEAPVSGSDWGTAVEEPPASDWASAYPRPPAGPPPSGPIAG